MPECLIVTIKEYLFVKETSPSIVMRTARSLFNSLWVQLNKFSFLPSWPPWLENQQSWIIKIGVEFIVQVSLVLSWRRLHEGQNYLFCNDKISDFLYYKKLWFFLLQIKWLASSDIPFSSSKTTCSISATFCWVLTSKGTSLMKDRLRFKAHETLDG